MLCLKIEKYFKEKLDRFTTILKITREQNDCVREKEFQRLNLCMAETTRIANQVRDLDKRYKDTLDAWNSAKIETLDDSAGKINKINTLIGRLQETMEAINTLQKDQASNLAGELEGLTKEFRKLRQDKKVRASYQDTTASPGLLDIKR